MAGEDKRRGKGPFFLVVTLDEILGFEYGVWN